MADILIRGMEMPERCDAKCPLYNTGRGYFDCVVTKQSYNWGLPGRPSDCPLHELPEHGDLISKDDAMNAILGEPPEAHYPSWYAGIVNEIPAIVPSNKEETE